MPTIIKLKSGLGKIASLQSEKEKSMTREKDKKPKIAKMFLVFITAVFLGFFQNNSCLAAETGSNNYSSPDYAYKFVGKDKFENFNRKIFLFNLKANKYLIRPINVVWASVMPQYAMDRIQSFYTNMTYPVRLVSCLCQKDFKGSKSETKRFFTNTTMGIGGLYDPAMTKYKIEPRQEDMGQALTYNKVKKGPYVVLPIVASGNVSDLFGQALDMPLNPTSYIVGPIALVSTGVSLVNSTTYMQPIAKMADSYADPYFVSKEIYGLERYIKNSNLDRREVFKEVVASQNVVKVANVSHNPDLKADIELKDYNPQGQTVDALRTMLFDSQKINNSKWSELSVWNKSFDKRIKTSSVNINFNRPNYKYRYILQKDTTAPLAILYPSIGEGIMSNQSAVLGKILYDEGYSLVILGSPFQWEFVKSMPENYRPGLLPQDAKYLRIVTSKVLDDVQRKKDCKFDKKILVGTSFGGLTTLFVASQEENDNTLNISNYISICPPIEIFFALKQLDKYSQDWKNNPEDIKLRAAVTAKKVIQIAMNDSITDPKTGVVSLPLNDGESKLAISFAMKQKLSDLVFTIENVSTSKSSDFYEKMNGMSFSDYAQKYVVAPQSKPFDQLSYDSSLYSMADFLQNSKKYRIYHALDDCFVSPEQLIWLKKQTHNKSVFFSNGSHLGFLYRKEFFNELTHDTRL